LPSASAAISKIYSKQVSSLSKVCEVNVLTGRSLGYNEDDGEAAGAVDAFDAGHFDVGGGGGAGYCGDWGTGGRFEFADGFRNGVDYLRGAHDAKVIIGNQRDGTAARASVAEDDGARERDGYGARGEDAFGAIQIGVGEIFVAGERKAAGFWQPVWADVFGDYQTAHAGRVHRDGNGFGQLC